MSSKEWLTRRLARLVTDAVVRSPALWRVFHGPFLRRWEQLAAGWDARRRPDHLAPFETALAAVGRAPRRALDIGTGTGSAAFAIAARFPEAEVVGVDFAEAMVEAARAKTPPELAARIRFERADAARLPFEDGAFDLAGLANAIPFFDELARVVAPGGTVVFGFSLGHATPIYVAPERLRAELGRRGFSDFAEFSAGQGTAFLARKRDLP